MTLELQVAGCGPPVLLVHGFGASIGLWRRTIPELAREHKVYAIDLLGFGDSEKPILDYEIEMWRDLVVDFQRDLVGEACILVGNSIGSLISLAAAQKNRAGTKGVVLMNCAGGMNNKARTEDWRIKVAYPLFMLIDLVLKTEILAARLFHNFRTTENIRKVLQSIYTNTEAVDDELVDIICRPGDDPNALAVFVSVFTGPPGPRPEDLMPDIDQPVLILWGDQDKLTPLDGPIGEWMRGLPQTRSNVQFHVVPESGHLPMDDSPDDVHGILLPWLHTVMERPAANV